MVGRTVIDLRGQVELKTMWGIDMMNQIGWFTLPPFCLYRMPNGKVLAFPPIPEEEKVLEGVEVVFRNDGDIGGFGPGVWKALFMVFCAMVFTAGVEWGRSHPNLNIED